jgi:hypothetical protein
MSEFRSLLRVELGSHHLRPGRTNHRISDSSGIRDFPPFKALEICSYPGDSGFYLMYEPETGQGTDTHHETLEDALSQAQWEFNILPAEWIKTDRPYT